MELAPELAGAHLARAYTLSNLRRYAEAKTHFEAAARINPNLFDAYYYYGRAACAAGEIEKSIALWRKAAEVRRAERLLEVNPQNGRVLSFGSGALIEDGQSERALEWARRAEALYPADMGVIINGALLRAKLGLKDEAMDLLERMFSKGWGKRDWVENDQGYDPLRKEPRFIAMLARLE